MRHGAPASTGMGQVQPGAAGSVLQTQPGHAGGHEGPVEAGPIPRSAAASWPDHREGTPTRHSSCSAVAAWAPHLQVLGFQGAIVLGDETCEEHQVSSVPGLGLGVTAVAQHSGALTVLRDGQEAHEAQALDGGHLWGAGLGGQGGQPGQVGQQGRWGSLPRGLTCRSMCSSMKLVLSRMSKPSSRAVAGAQAASPQGSCQPTELGFGLSCPPNAPGNGAATPPYIPSQRGQPDPT